MTDTFARPAVVDGRRPPPPLFRDLRTSAGGRGAREAARRLTVHGLNELTRRRGRTWPAELLARRTARPVVVWAADEVLRWWSRRAGTFDSARTTRSAKC